MPRPAPTNYCACCRVPVADGLLMCALHWRRVPADLQARVHSTWRRFRAAGIPGARLQLLRDYYRARDAAIQAAQTKLQPGAADTPQTLAQGVTHVHDE